MHLSPSFGPCGPLPVPAPPDREARAANQSTFQRSCLTFCGSPVPGTTATSAETPPGSPPEHSPLTHLSRAACEVLSFFTSCPSSTALRDCGARLASHRSGPREGTHRAPPHICEASTWPSTPAAVTARSPLALDVFPTDLLFSASPPIKTAENLRLTQRQLPLDLSRPLPPHPSFTTHNFPYPHYLTEPKKGTMSFFKKLTKEFEELKTSFSDDKPAAQQQQQQQQQPPQEQTGSRSYGDHPQQQQYGAPPSNYPYPSQAQPQPGYGQPTPPAAQSAPPMAAPSVSQGWLCQWDSK
ncbi:hypothetical protein CCHR01_16589 [Colletotrichum chrysophilum]|uniref:Uncharacterized protein n=1 Tax=Colletotrichum chrysophilum TaxID=1836956 RepID=A0AAD9EAQ3_9PEZI|nr:hypothetical protein CCHR01_16589 [Colletotrichum chrysophilum]